MMQLFQPDDNKKIYTLAFYQISGEWNLTIVDYPEIHSGNLPDGWSWSEYSISGSLQGFRLQTGDFKMENILVTREGMAFGQSGQVSVDMGGPLVTNDAYVFPWTYDGTDMYVVEARITIIGKWT